MKKCKDEHGVIYGYHFGNSGYDKIRPFIFQDDSPDSRKDEVKEYLGEKRFESYQHEVSLMMFPLNSEQIGELVKNGFNAWDVPNITIYKVNLTKQADKIDYINLESIPEYNKWYDKNWDEFYDKYSTVDEDTFMELRKVLTYKMCVETGIPRGVFIKDLKDIIHNKDWCDSDKHLKVNISKGNKNQYASYLPHFNIRVSEPLDFEEVTTIRS